MKMKTDLLGEIEISKIITDEWEKHKVGYEDIEEFISENAYDFLMQCQGKLVDKELAIFLCNYNIGIIPAWGGYHADAQFSFEDSGHKYTVLAFGWNDDSGRPNINMIAYKEVRSKES